MRRRDFGTGRCWGESFLSLATVGAFRSIPPEGRWENFAAAVAWLAVVPWSAHLMRGGTGPALLGGAGALETVGDLVERVFLLRSGSWGILLVPAFDLIPLALSVTGIVVLWRDRDRG